MSRRLAVLGVLLALMLAYAAPASAATGPTYCGHGVHRLSDNTREAFAAQWTFRDSPEARTLLGGTHRHHYVIQRLILGRWVAMWGNTKTCPR